MNTTHLPFTSETYTERREALMKEIGSGKIFFQGNGNSSKNYADNYYNFRQDSTFLYYIGLNIPYLNAVIDVDNNETILFGDDISLDHIVWMGDQEKLADQAARAGILKVLPSRQIFDYVDKRTLYLPPYRSAHTIKLEEYLGIKEINPSVKLILAVIKQRNIKSEEELKYLYEASDLTAKMHFQIMSNAHAGLKEYQLVSMASQFAWDNNASWSFTPIMTTQGQILHNHNYSRTLEEGGLLLFDGGIEIASGYAGDMTRTFPIAKEYTERQKAVYDIVYQAHIKSRDLSKPGVRNLDAHLCAASEIVEGLKHLGLMKGDTEEAVEAGAHSLFFQHGLGHMIGLDVHDMENLGEDFVGYDENIIRSTQFGLKSLRLARPLEEGNTITIEPGIYFIPQLIDIWKAENKLDQFINYDEVVKFKDFGGIRLENDYVVTSEGVDLLGDELAMSSDDVAEVRSGI